MSLFPLIPEWDDKDCVFVELSTYAISVSLQLIPVIEIHKRQC